MALPTQTPITEAWHTAGFLVSEANGHRSREAVVLITGQNLQAGTVLGRITASGKLTAFDPGSALGPQTAMGILYSAVDATAADRPVTIIARDAEVNLSELVWGVAVTTTPQKTAALVSLATIGIIGR